MLPGKPSVRMTGLSRTFRIIYAEKWDPNQDFLLDLGSWWNLLEKNVYSY